MSVVVSNVEVGPWRRELKVEVPAEEVEQQTRQVVDAYRRQARIPGFRKGKVPANIVRQRFAQDIREEVQEKLLQRYWFKVRDEAELDPLVAPRIGDVEHEDGKPLSFVLTVEVRPDIEVKSLEGFDLPTPEVEPTDEEVENTLNDLRRELGTWKTVERSAAQGDRVQGRIRSLDEGEETATDEGEPEDGEEKEPADRPVHFEVGHPRVWEELSLAATGAKAGQKVEFSRQEQGEDNETTVLHYSLEVDTVQEIELAELDDELAKKVSGLDSLDEFLTDLRGRIRESKESRARREREVALRTQLRERHPMELPAWVVEEEVRQLVNDYAEELARQGVDVQNTPINWESIAQEARPDAERRVHDRLVIDAIAEAESIQVPDADVEAFIAAVAHNQRRSVHSLRQQLAEAGKLDALRAQMRRDRAVRHLLGDLPEAEAEGAQSDEPGADEGEAGEAGADKK